MTTALALLAGAIVGLALGALGGGGSVLTVPALVYLLGFSPQHAGTASLLVVVTTSAAALLAHARANRVNWRLGGLFAAAGVLPALTAGALTRHVPDTVLTAAFAVTALASALSLLRCPAPTATRKHPAAVGGVGAGLGAVTGLLGVGGGFLAVPALVAVLAVPMSAAVGTSLLVIVVNGLAATATRLPSFTGLDWTVLGPFAAAALLGAWDGKRLAHRVDPTTLRRAFAVVLLVVSVGMLAEVVA
ncbi:sulfite exporter TauE/SafE family protein [Actinosynnema sp. NPDC020468]|uniref:sulfite exporter TauE/SafE family protein n=1 Tax=Actinosynnema sp. NPDC020468 TaxID=3154488 RepID=UPI0033E3BF0B